MNGSHPLDVIRPEVARTLPGLLLERVRRTPDRPAYRWHGRAGWESITWLGLLRQVRRWQAGLQQEGLLPGERVAILLPNGVPWVTLDQAAMGLGLVVVSLYANDRPLSVAHILADSGARLLLIKDLESWDRLREVLEAAPALRRVVCLESSGGGRPVSERFRYADQWLPTSEALPLEPPPAPHDLAALVYTSGTTGLPKGVMLSHGNILSNAHGGLMKVAAYADDLFLSFLPLSHALERTAGYILPMMAGAEVAFARSVVTLGEDLVSVRPTVIISVPRIYERIFSQIHHCLEVSGEVSCRLLRLTERVGWRRFLHSQGRGEWSAGELLWPLLKRLVARRLLQRLGGRLRVAVSGGAPLAPRVARLFLSLGVPLVQGYGLTETAPVIAVNTLADNDPHSVGLPLAGVEIRIGALDELWVRGPNITAGYWGNPTATRRVLDEQGWFHTGDQARLGENGHLYITGRLKDITVLSNGRKVAAGDIEAALVMDPLFQQVVVVGEGRPYLAAMAVLEPVAWSKLAQSRGLDPDDPANLDNVELHHFLLERMGEAMALFPGFARIRRLALLREPWSVENGLMTPTLKLRRESIIHHHAEVVARLYQGHH